MVADRRERTLLTVLTTVLRDGKKATPGNGCLALPFWVGDTEIRGLEGDQ